MHQFNHLDVSLQSGKKNKLIVGCDGRVYWVGHQREPISNAKNYDPQIRLGNLKAEAAKTKSRVETESYVAVKQVKADVELQVRLSSSA